MSTTDIVFDGWPLIGYTDRGGRSKVTGMTGWLTKSMRRERKSRSGDDGDWTSSGTVDGKTITITGQAVYDSAQDAAVDRRLMLALGGRGLSELVVSDALGSLSALVEVDAMDVSVVRDTMLVFTITVHAPDPLLYGAPVSLSAGASGALLGTGRVWPRAWPRDWGNPVGAPPNSIIVPNDGSVPYWPILRVNGPVDSAGFTVSVDETGDSLTYAGPLLDGQWVDIDCRNRRVLINGNLSHLYKVTFRGRWLAVPVGGAAFTLSAIGATASTSLEVSGFEGAYL
ncbi:hypothetical protein [Terrabacter sp. NPDC000476]|uniref:phage distal tail protein n=1 Tax=Terrabacter sp. NPDC000476 TaxID=3154258 RepID=UPI00331F0BAE